MLVSEVRGMRDSMSMLDARVRLLEEARLVEEKVATVLGVFKKEGLADKRWVAGALLAAVSTVVGGLTLVLKLAGVL